jgi:molybdopterin converting factor small subunit
LFALLPESERAQSAGRTIELDADSWDDVVTELRRRTPVLADKAITDSSAVASGFVLVVNNEVIPNGQTYPVSPGDELALIAAIAGG